LGRGLEFYRGVGERLGQPQISWNEMRDLLKQPKAPERFNPKGHLQLWEQIRASHHGFQLGLELLGLPLAIGREVNYFGFRGNERLEIDIPREFTRPESVEELMAELIPVSENRGDEVLSWSGGTFYSCETPQSEPFVQIGDHVEPGNQIGLLEVMKMFNPVRAECSGTIREICVDGTAGVNVTRGQRLFRLEPDHHLQGQSDAERIKLETETTLRLLNLE